MTLVSLLLLLLLPGPPLLLTVQALAVGDAAASTVTVAVYPWNASRIDLSNRGLAGRLILIFSPDPTMVTTTATPIVAAQGRTKLRQEVKLLDLSGNPNLSGFSIEAAKGDALDVLISQLNIGRTRMAPLPGHLFQPTPNSSKTSINVCILKADGTNFDQPIDLNLATDHMYNLRVESFFLAGWKLIDENRLPVNLTSHQNNNCHSKLFRSLYISRLRSKDGVEIVGVKDSSSLLAVSETADFSDNRLRAVAYVNFSAHRVDLSHNQLTELPGVVFRPGSVCGASVTDPTTLILKQNKLGPKVLDDLAGQRFGGLDLAENPGLIEAGTTESPIFVSDFLDLSGLWGRENQLSTLLTNFRHYIASSMHAESAYRRFRLSLADNWLPDLASAAGLAEQFLSNGIGNRSLHLDVSGNPRLVHLNLSDVPTRVVTTLIARRLPHLHTVSIRVDGDAAAAAMERLRRRGQRPEISDLLSMWSRQGSTLLLDAQPSDCCLRADASELVCSFVGHSAAAGHSSQRSRRGSVFCYGDGDGTNVDGYNFGFGRLPHPAELPLLFSCVVLGGALLLGLVTGVAFFYARRRSRGKYAVYGVYDVQKLKNLQQQQQQHQLASVGRNRSGFGCAADDAGKPVLLKAVSVVQLAQECEQLGKATSV